MYNIEAMKRILPILIRAADGRASLGKELDEVLGQMLESIKNINKIKLSLSKAKQDKNDVFEKWARILEPIKMYMADLHVKFMGLREAHLGELEALLSQISDLHDKATVATDTVRARLKEVAREADEATIEQLVDHLKKRKKLYGDLGSRLEGLAEEWQAEQEVKFRSASSSFEEALEVTLLDSKAEADRLKVESEKKAKELRKQKYAPEVAAMVAELEKDIADKDKEAAALEEAAKKVKSGKKAHRIAEHGDSASAAADAMEATMSEQNSLVRSIADMFGQMLDGLGELMGIATSTPEGPEATTQDDTPEETDEDSNGESGEEENESVEGSYRAAASIDPQTDEAQRLRKVDAVREEASKVLRAFDSNRARRHLLGLIKKEFEGKHTELAQASIKSRGLSAKIKEEEKRLEDLKGKALDLMKRLGESERSIKDKLSVKIKKLSVRPLSEEAIEAAVNNADAFQGWLASEGKIIDEENPAVLAAIEQIKKADNAVKMAAEIATKREPEYPSGTKETVEKGLREKTKEWEAKRREKEQKERGKKSSSLITSAADDAAAAYAEYMDSLESSIASMEDYVDMMEAAAIALDEMEWTEIPATTEEEPEEGASWMDWLAPSPEMQLAPAPASRNPESVITLVSASARAFPSEHDQTGGFWELVEGEGGSRIVINKDLKAKIRKRLETSAGSLFSVGAKVAIDMGDSIALGSVAGYSEGVYKVESGGVVYGCSASRLLPADTNPWR